MIFRVLALIQLFVHFQVVDVIGKLFRPLRFRHHGIAFLLFLLRLLLVISLICPIFILFDHSLGPFDVDLQLI